MTFRPIPAILLAISLASGLALHAIETTATSKTKAHTPAKPKRAPAAKPPKGKKHTTTKSSARRAHTSAVSLRPPHVSLNTREVITDRITHSLASTRIGIENSRALRPFFDQLAALQADPHSQLVRVIQFGDSHTAADMFTGALRTLFQDKFGDGGAGFQYAGYPFAGYHIHGTKRAQSTGWIALGTHLRDIGDGLVGMGGVSLSTEAAGNWVSLDADATSLEVQYLIQPNGGSIEIRDNDQLLATVSTAPGDSTTVDPASPAAAGHFNATVPAGPHHFEVLTTQAAPVRLLGLSTENASGVTYEAAGINGAEASLFLRWNEALQQTLMAEVNPALIVLSYGTNEAGDHNWTEDSYASLFRRIIERCRRLAPNASILVIGPPDRAMHNGRHGWAAFTGVDRIVAAQRAVCRQMHCAYWDQRSRMGGFGSMRDWVAVSWAQPDHTHFTGEGYNELASALFSDIVQQYDNYHPPIVRAQSETK